MLCHLFFCFDKQSVSLVSKNKLRYCFQFLVLCEYIWRDCMTRLYQHLCHQDFRHELLKIRSNGKTITDNIRRTYQIVNGILLRGKKTITKMTNISFPIWNIKTERADMKCLVFVTYNYLIIEFDGKHTSPFVLVSSGDCKKMYRKNPYWLNQTYHQQ